MILNKKKIFVHSNEIGIDFPNINIYSTQVSYLYAKHKFQYDMAANIIIVFNSCGNLF